MESRLSVAGHPVQLILVMFPLGLLATGVIFDAADLFGGPALLGEVAYWSIAAGIVGGLLAVAAGLVDLPRFPAGTRARRVAASRALVNLAVLLLFAVVLMVRLGADGRAAGGGLLVVEVVALAAAGLGAWFGGELLDRLGVAGDREGNPDPPGSMSRSRANLLGELGGV